MTLATESRHSLDNPDWMTPKPIIEAAREVMGSIDLDPASDAEANAVVQATHYYTQEMDGLQQPWFGSVFLNPPGGQVNEFWRALYGAYWIQRITQAVWIGYSLEQLQTLQRACAYTPLHYPICVPKQRIAFVENAAMKAARIQRLLEKGEAPGASEAAQKTAAAIRAGKEPPNSPSHANYISYLGPNVDAFARVFRQFGQVRR